MKSIFGCSHTRQPGAPEAVAGKEAGKLLSISFIALITLASLSSICKGLTLHRNIISWDVTEVRANQPCLSPPDHTVWSPRRFEVLSPHLSTNRPFSHGFFASAMLQSCRGSGFLSCWSKGGVSLVGVTLWCHLKEHPNPPWGCSSNFPC